MGTELPPTQLPADRKTWINEQLQGVPYSYGSIES